MIPKKLVVVDGLSALLARKEHLVIVITASVHDLTLALVLVIVRSGSRRLISLTLLCLLKSSTVRFVAMRSWTTWANAAIWSVKFGANQGIRIWFRHGFRRLPQFTSRR